MESGPTTLPTVPARPAPSTAWVNCGLTVAVKLGVDRDRNNPQDEGRNVILAAIAPQHPDYARLMGAAPGAAFTPPAAPQAAASSQSPPNGSAPFWAQ